jgi:hypothetical protein
MARAVKPLRIAVLMHPDFIPPDDADGYSDTEVNKWKTEYDVVSRRQPRPNDERSQGRMRSQPKRFGAAESRNEANTGRSHP